MKITEIPNGIEGPKKVMSVWIPMEEYRDLLITKGRYEELKKITEEYK